MKTSQVPQEPTCHGLPVNPRMSVDTLEFKRDVLLAAQNLDGIQWATGTHGHYISFVLQVGFCDSVCADPMCCRLELNCLVRSCEVLYGGRVAGDEFQRTIGAFFAIYWLLRCGDADGFAGPRI